MADSPTSRRQYFMHPAHRSIGVFGNRALEGAGQIEEFSARRLDIPGQASIATVCHPADESARPTLRCFERLLCQYHELACEPLEFSSFDASSYDVGRADCVVMFHHGLHIARRWSDLDPQAFAASAGDRIFAERASVDIATAARFHPVLQGVAAFFYDGPLCPVATFPVDASCLLVTQGGEAQTPVAWTRDRAQVFSTILTGEKAFRQASFVCLVRNALAWVRRSRI